MTDYEAYALAHPEEAARRLPEIVPIIADRMVDGRKSVRDEATRALLACCQGISNGDIRPFLPTLVACIEDPARVPECIRALAATTFAQTVDASTLAITVPVLLRGLSERSTPVRRQCCVIIDTMAKLVERPEEATSFVDALIERVERVVSEISNPEARSVAEKTLKTLRDPRFRSSASVGDGSHDDDVGRELCDCTLSLAYGAKILLNTARLRLVGGKRYGLCGPNGVGKSTLMRAIANGRVEGFPSRDDVRVEYVEHDIDSSESDMSVAEFIGSDTVDGFDDATLRKSVAALSGGWKMRAALARATMRRADVLLLDEPTNHLDVTNVAWLETYLRGLENVTSVIVSHDSGFLDAVCTHIIHYEDRKLVTYAGNLSVLVRHRPEAAAYYSLRAPTTVAWKFPPPGFLEGVTSKDRAILKMRDVSFAYPSRSPVFEGASLQVSLNSRVAVLGPNGAGKSTLVKILTGELEPSGGTVWKHQNLRVAYVAQHAFHHIEHHLDKTPNRYIQWRYATGEDREGLSRVERRVSDEDAKKLAALKVKPEQLLNRRKLKQTYEYEVKWENSAETTWMTKPKLEAMGCSKMIADLDAREAASAGTMGRPLTAASIETMLADLGLEPEFATHSFVRGLSGGQKVKVVLGAVMWQQPHVLVLDEPTNYLDRESLAGLVAAIESFEGGVVVISHNREFVRSANLTETWTVGGGRVVVEGGSERADAGIIAVREETTVDAFGNTVRVVEAPRELSRKERKAMKKMKDARRARGEEVSDDDDDDL
jgi:elongation factor 3